MNYPLQGEVSFTPFPLGLIWRIQIEVLGNFLLGHIVQKAVFLDV